MSRGRPRRAWPRLALVLVAGLCCACASANKPRTEAPAPSEEYEEALVGSTSPQAETSAEDPELAAKQAAAQKVLETVKDRDPEEEKKKLARSHAISAQAGQKLAKGQMQEAVQVARQALKVHEQNVDAMLVIAQVYYKEGKYELVRAVCSSALQIDPKIRTPEETSRAYNLQGFAMMAMGEDGSATQSFKKAAEVDENNAVAWNNLGTRYLDAGDVSTALSCFEYTLKLDPRFAEAHLNHGAALRASRKWEEAEAAMRKALELRRNYAEAYFNLGVLYLDADPFPGLETTQRLNKAIQNLTKYRELAIADGGARPGRPAPSFAGAKAPPPRVSKERADDYIRVAKKGIEREQRRLDREKERKAAGATPATADDGGQGSPATDEAPTGEAPPDEGGDEGGDEESPEPATPTQPSVQGPNTQSPGGSSPSQPAPKQPAPSQPTPTQPAPTQPTPKQPAPKQPAPTQPAKPSQPAPTQPAPTQPPPKSPTPTPVQPSKPPPQGPGSSPAPKPPPPQKPSVQKPQSAGLGVGWRPKKISLDPASRGTRSAALTLNSLEAGPAVLAMSSVDLASALTEFDTMLPFGTASTRLMVLAVHPTHPSFTNVVV